MSKPTSGKWTSLLRARPDVWFPEPSIEALKVVQRALRDQDEIRRIAAELRADGYSVLEPKPSWHSEDQWLVSRYFLSLIKALWPEPLAKALWDKDRKLGPEDMEALIRFLEIDPFFFRTGYIKPDAIKRLGWHPLTKEQQARVFRILERIVYSGWERQMKDWRKLARLCDQEDVRQFIVKALKSEKDAVVKRATILGLCMLGKTELLGNVSRYSCSQLYCQAAITRVQAAFL